MQFDTDMVRWLALLLLLLCTYALAGSKLSCDSFPTPEFREVCMQCSGALVLEVPRYLPRTLRMLLMTDTAVSALDATSFEGRDLPELRRLHVNGGTLTTVGEGAFCGLPALEVLHLDHTELEFVDALSFNCSRHLKTVSLVGNPSLRQLPPLASPWLEHLYLDDCRLESFDVATVAAMPALQVLSLTGNPDLHCASLRSQFQRARPNLRVDCGNSAGDLPPSASPGDRETTTEESLTEAPYTATDTKTSDTDDRERTTEDSHTEPHSTTENGKDESTENAASHVGVVLGSIAMVAVVVIIIAVLYFRYGRGKSISRSSDDPAEQALKENV